MNKVYRCIAFLLLLGILCGLPVHAAGTVPGDINADGQVNNKDLTRLFQYLSGYEVAVEKEMLDLNGDGAENNKDLTRLFQYLSGYNVQLSTGGGHCYS